MEKLTRNKLEIFHVDTGIVLQQLTKTNLLRKYEIASSIKKTTCLKNIKYYDTRIAWKSPRTWPATIYLPLLARFIGLLNSRTLPNRICIFSIFASYSLWFWLLWKRFKGKTWADFKSRFAEHKKGLLLNIKYFFYASPAQGKNSLANKMTGKWRILSSLLFA